MRQGAVTIFLASLRIRLIAGLHMLTFDIVAGSCRKDPRSGQHDHRAVRTVKSGHVNFFLAH